MNDIFYILCSGVDFIIHIFCVIPAFSSSTCRDSNAGTRGVPRKCRLLEVRPHNKCFRLKGPVSVLHYTSFCCCIPIYYLLSTLDIVTI